MAKLLAASAFAHVGWTLLEPCSILWIDQSVSKHAVRFMQPQQGDVARLSGGLGVSPHDPLDDSGDIPQVEGVVGLGGGG